MPSQPSYATFLSNRKDKDMNDDAASISSFSSRMGLLKEKAKSKVSRSSKPKREEVKETDPFRMILTVPMRSYL